MQPVLTQKAQDDNKTKKQQPKKKPQPAGQALEKGYLALALVAYRTNDAQRGFVDNDRNTIWVINKDGKWIGVRQCLPIDLSPDAKLIFKVVEFSEDNGATWQQKPTAQQALDEVYGLRQRLLKA